MSSTIENIYPLTPVQQGLLYHAVYDPESGDYVEQLICNLNSTLNLTAFRRTWQHLMERHQSLRTSFHWEGLSKPMQVVHRGVALPWQQYDWRTLSPDEQEERWQNLLREDRRCGFDLTQPPLMRLTLIRMGDDSYRFVWSHHHILLDGWCMPLLMKEMLLLYEAYQEGRKPQLAHTRPYADYIEWLQRQDLSKAEAFWRQMLSGFTAPTQLPMKPLREDESETIYVREIVHLTTQTTEALRRLARSQQLTMNTLMQGAWAILLSRYSGTHDVMFGTTVSGRPAELAGIETMTGLFINTLPVRVRVPPDALLLPWLKKLQAQQVEMREYEYSPLVEVQGWSEVPRGLPLFESLLVYQNYPVDASLQEQVSDPKAGLEISDFKAVDQTNYPLNVGIVQSRELMLQIGYDARRFEAEAIRRMLAHFQNLLESMATDPEQSLSSLSMLTERERRQQLYEWNETATDYPHDRCIHELFEEQVERTPEAVAVVFEEQQLSYRELNQRANQLAHYLRTQGVRPEQVVGILMDRSIEMVVSVLGVLKAGAAYLPLDPEYPQERLTFMLADADVQLVLTQQQMIEQVSWSQVRVLAIDEEEEKAALLLHGGDNLNQRAGAQNLSYVIYTSGSTGRPKGVMIEHSSLVNLALAQRRAFGVSTASRLLQFASFGFDASVSELFVSLCAGATLYLWRPDSGLFSTTELVEELRARRVTVVTLPPSVLMAVEANGLTELETVVAAGEKCSAEAVLRWAVGRRMLNAYGPTEATVCASIGECVVGGEAGVVATPSIGRAIANVAVYILDERMQPVPVGVRGELYIGGRGVGRGYLNRPELTAERFVPHPFSTEKGERLYRTGDIARYLADGNIEFIGRIDEQVKVRGYRIELGEVEAVLAGHTAISEAVVIVREDVPGDQRLVAYLVTIEGQQLTNSELRSYLQERLPAFMIPSAFVQLEELPLTPNGKVDRRALPAPELSRRDDVESYVAPHTPTEELLVSIWSEVLRVKKVGVNDNFFELGGQSLLATQLVSRIRGAFGVDVRLKRLFKSPTVKELAQHVDELMRAGEGIEAPPIVQVPREQPLPLSYAQQRLWFLDQLEPGSALYNIPLAARLDGPLDTSALERTLNEVIRRHEVLRTSFVFADGQPVQVIAPELHLELPTADLSHLVEAEREVEIRRVATAEAAQPFDLNYSPLLRARLLRLNSEEHILLLTMHHIISDGWSMSVLVREVSALYQAFTSGQSSPLEELPIQYADYAVWQRDQLQGDALEQQLAYWREQLTDAPQVLELPTDRARPAVQNYRGAVETFLLDRELMAQLKQLSREQNITLFMMLLAAFQTLLYRYSNQSDILVGTPIANRTRAETESLIGFFVNTLVLRGRFNYELSFRELLEQVREVSLGAYAHQELPFERLVEELQPERSLSHTPLFQVMFTLQNAPLPSSQLGGLRMSAGGETAEQAAKFELSLAMMEGEEGLAGAFEYRAELFDAETVRRMIRHFEQALRATVADAEQKVSDIELLSKDEREQMLLQWNSTRREVGKWKSITELFEEQVERTPDALAVVFEEQQLSYRELNQRANQLAHYLRTLGIRPEQIVGIMMNRSTEMLIAVLAVLKAGAAYLPLDPEYPQERLSFMLRDAGIRILLTQQLLLQQLPQSEAVVIAVDQSEEIRRGSVENPVSEVSAENLAYVIYTSGSTGQPKGVMVRHAGVSNVIAASIEGLGVDHSSRVLQAASLSFDASVLEIFSALLSGACLFLVDVEMLISNSRLSQLMRDRAITFIASPPSRLDTITENEFPDLRTIIVGGESCSADTVARWSGGRRFFNAYAPTETTIYSTLFECSEITNEHPPVGRPIANTEIYLLDQKLNPAPLGARGELYIGGTGIARGYLNRPELTAERFIPNPFGSEPGARLYRTGDLARYLPDGNIQFIGRADQQVKLRGFRIELGEIETALGQHPAARETVVILREDRPGDKRLIAYLVMKPTADGETLPTASEWRGYLKEKLPEYMIPSAFVRLEELPLTATGKIDRRALPAPELNRTDVGEMYVEPRTAVEKMLSDLWSEVLGIERVGIRDNFFELGGHSLLATQLISRVREDFQVDVELRTLFELPTVEGLAEIITLKTIEQEDPQEIARLLDALEQMSEEEVGVTDKNQDHLPGGFDVQPRE